MENSRLLTVRQLAADPAYPFTGAALRAHIFNAASRQSSKGTISGNGLEPAIIRRGRKILIIESKFREWLEDGEAK